MAVAVRRVGSRADGERVAQLPHGTFTPVGDVRGGQFLGPVGRREELGGNNSHGWCLSGTVRRGEAELGEP
ncbi:hypothetical protein Abr02nite_69680 [Paractinoplanes brasiliensis]|nr:hypothetical protein Abr02nite_69680 [Actinoplanes brasiliensis]